MAKKNIGGAARKRELTLHEIDEIQNLAFEAGVQQGREIEQKLVRLKSANECPMCAQKLELEAVKQRLAVKEHPHRKGRFA